MKRLTVILLAMFGLVLFNSCKDDKDDNPQPTATNILNELKGYAGQSADQIASIMQSKGFRLSESEVEFEIAFYTFINSDSTKQYDFMEYESKICMLSYEIINNTRSTLISTFEKNSQNAISFIANTPLISYEAEIGFDEFDSQEYDNRSLFLADYNINKNNAIYISEFWMTANYIVGSEFNYEEEDGHYSLIGYGDMNLMPPFFKSNNKSIFEMLNKKSPQKRQN
ncbi:MAG: hypothetical protein PHO12_06900 [Bacteroidales bacterium]|nr:hypothetical protein [Bacteroidales bacterium]MDD4684568.1 hypothetical protein [Bacteroidales bacterium]